MLQQLDDAGLLFTRLRRTAPSSAGGLTAGAMASIPSCLAASRSPRHRGAHAQPATTACARLCAAAPHQNCPWRWDRHRSTGGIRSSPTVPPDPIGWHPLRSEAAARRGDFSRASRLRAQPGVPQPGAEMPRQPCEEPYRPRRGSERCRREKGRGPLTRRALAGRRRG